MQFINTSSKYIKVKIVAKAKHIPKKIVLPFSIAKKYNNSLQSFVQNIVFIKSLLISKGYFETQRGLVSSNGEKTESF